MAEHLPEPLKPLGVLPPILFPWILMIDIVDNKVTGLQQCQIIPVLAMV